MSDIEIDVPFHDDVRGRTAGERTRHTAKRQSITGSGDSSRPELPGRNPPMHGRSLPHRLPRWVRLGGGFGAFLEVILALANVGTAVSLYPVVKRQNEGVALGYVGLRTLESGIIAVGIVSLLAVVTLWQHLAGDLRLGDRRAVRLYTRVSAWGAVTAVPVFAWEISLALYLIVKGFRPSAAAGLHASPVVAGAQPVAA